MLNVRYCLLLDVLLEYFQYLHNWHKKTRTCPFCCTNVTLTVDERWFSGDVQDKAVSGMVTSLKSSVSKLICGMIVPGISF
jgi:hypothetical protein